ncbi:MAG: hypothetical protein RL483_80 [Pseudomonadota bacterium]|jgi:alanine racemase
MPRPALLTVHEPALAHNLAQVRRLVGSSRIWAVAKARGYGVGLASCLRGFEQADGLAVLELVEAQTLRDSGWTRPILLLEGAFSAADVRQALEAELDLVVHQPDQLGWLLAQRQALARSSCRVWIKLNTGMHRLGFPVVSGGLDESLQKGLAPLRAVLPASRLGFMTHFACADDPTGVDGQLAVWQSVQPALGLRAGESLSLANSAAVVRHPSTHADWVRPGIMLYGGDPLAGQAPESRPTQPAIGLQPAATLSSQLIAVQTVAAGGAVGYGARYRAPSDMRIGVVAMGYADGYLRCAPDGTPVLVDGVRCPLVGQVSMDMITVDLGPVPAARVGSSVTLWGQGLSIDEVAACCSSNAYELLTGVTSRVTRRVEPLLPA